MKASLLASLAFIAASGLVQAAPVNNFLDVGDQFDVGPPPPKNGNKDLKREKVLAIPVRFDGDNREVMLTRGQNSTKNLEFIRGKMKKNEHSTDAARRETWEEVALNGKVDHYKSEHTYTDKDDKEINLHAHIVKVPKNQHFAHNNENRERYWIDHTLVPSYVTREEQLRAWADLSPRIAP